MTERDQPVFPDEFPDEIACETCGARARQPYAYCGNCRACYCLACARAHYCTPHCQANGCLAGLCVRLVDGGALSRTWGVPASDVPAG